MTNKNKKVSSALLPGEFYCGKCNQHLKKELRQKGKVHCISCEKRGVEARKNYVDKPVTMVSQSTLDARDIRQRAADLMLEMEIRQANGNHLADYL
tara:strand:- start:941 stop:1228 length:288 start_codon:yes stop_codon:yes gene_type:complete